VITVACVATAPPTTPVVLGRFSEAHDRVPAQVERLRLTPSALASGGLQAPPARTVIVAVNRYKIARADARGW